MYEEYVDTLVSVVISILLYYTFYSSLQIVEYRTECNVNAKNWLSFSPNLHTLNLKNMLIWRL